MIDTTTLAAELEKPEYSGLTDAEILATLNAENIEFHIPVSSVDVATYLMETVSHKSTQTEIFTLYNILSLTYRDSTFSDVVRSHAENIIDLATGVDRLLSLKENPMYAMATGSLVSADRWSQDEADGLLNFGKRTRSRATEILERDAVQSDLDTVKVYPKYLQVQTLYEPARATADKYEQALLQLRNGVDVDLDTL